MFQFIKRLCLICCAILVAGCGDTGEPVDAARLDRDQAVWNKTGPTDYNLEWQSLSTRNKSVYRVYVRGGKVQAVRMLRPDGKAIALKPADMEFYSVPGLFKTIREELLQSQQTQPFGRPAGTTVVLSIRTDPKYGYPTFYRRDIFGVDERLGINVIKMEPTDAAVPPADPPR